MKRSALFILSLAMLSAAVFADEAPPPRKFDPVETRLQVHIDQNTEKPKLVIDRATLERLYQGDGAVGAFLPDGLSRSRTLFGGLLISASFVFGGVWLARRKTKAGVFAASALFAVGVGVFTVSGNAAPPTFRRIDSAMFSERMNKERFGFGDITIEVAEEGADEGVRLIVPKVKTQN